MSNLPKSVCVFGAGIAGLSAAHELAEHGYKVTVYEYESSPGGMARSFRYPQTDALYPGLPSEYSWRGYGEFYKNVFHMMNKIPSPILPDKTVYETELSRPVKFILVENNVTNVSDASAWSQHFTIKDWITLLGAYLRELASDNRTNFYATINAADYFKPKLNERTYNQT